jgi:hypothetical protein
LIVRRSLKYRKRRLPQRLLLRNTAATQVGREFLDFADQTQSIARLRRPRRWSSSLRDRPDRWPITASDSTPRLSLRKAEKLAESPSELLIFAERNHAILDQCVHRRRFAQAERVTPHPESITGLATQILNPQSHAALTPCAL